MILMRLCLNLEEQDLPVELDCKTYFFMQMQTHRIGVTERIGFASEITPPQYLTSSRRLEAICVMVKQRQGSSWRPTKMAISTMKCS